MGSSCDGEWIYKVFVNFRGEDSRESFVSHLEGALTRAEITTFIDEQLSKGTEVGPELMRAIEGSQISLVVFSKTYTKSSWCLNELVRIMECRKTYGQVVMPIFYHVRATVVRHQKGAFGKYLDELAKSKYFDEEEKKAVLSSWKGALTEAANLNGFSTTKYRNEYNLVNIITDEVLKTLNGTLLSITKIVQMKSFTTIKQAPFSKSVGDISLTGNEDLPFPSLISSWISLTMNPLSYIHPFQGVSSSPDQKRKRVPSSLVSMDMQNHDTGDLVPMLGTLSKLRSFLVRCDTEIQLQKFMYDVYGVNYTELQPSSSAPKNSDLSLRYYLIGIGNYQQVLNTLSNSIPQTLKINQSRDVSLLGGNYPYWLTHTSEGRSVFFAVPQENHHCLKGMTVCVVYSSSPGKMAVECLTSVVIVNHTKFTIQIYKRNTVISYNDEDWQGMISNLGPGDQVEIFATFGRRLDIKKTAVFLIYDDEPNNMEMTSSSDVTVTENCSGLCCTPPPVSEMKFLVPLEPKENGFKTFIRRFIEQVLLCGGVWRSRNNLRSSMI